MSPSLSQKFKCFIHSQSEVTLDLWGLRRELLIHFDAAGVACTNRDVWGLLNEYCWDVTQHESRWSLTNGVEGTIGLPKIVHIALQVAAKRGHVRIVKVLLKLDGIDPNFEGESTDSLKAAPLHLAAEEGHSAVVKLLLAAVNINPDARDRDDYTPLIYACRKGHVSIVQQLLARNDVNCNALASTPLIEACWKGHKEIINLLLAKDGIDINLIPLITAAKMEWDPSVLKLLLAQEGIDSEVISAALITTVSHNWVESAKLFLERDDINVNIPNCFGQTALYLACHRVSHELVHLLLERDGIDPNAGAIILGTPHWPLRVVIMTAATTYLSYARFFLTAI
jgi:ankyrin repeat protein